MSLTTFFRLKATETTLEELPEIFPLLIKQSEFINTDVVNMYAKILTDVVERINGLSDDQAALLWDNCLMSSSKDGLITMIAKAMSDKKDLFIVYDQAVQVVRHATPKEEQQIKADYEKTAKSDVGIFVSFKNYVRSDMLKLYSSLEYLTVSSLNKSMNLSKAIQFKMKDMRASVSLGDSAGAIDQAKLIAKSLGHGRDVMLDAGDMIETSRPDLSSVKESIIFLDSKRSFYLGLPEAYINGVQTGGLGTTGENDTKATERGLKNYYFSIVKPIIETLFEIKVTYKSQDFRQIGQALEAMKTFELTSEELLNIDQKKKIIEGLLDINEKDNKTKPAKEITPVKPVIEKVDA